MSDHWNAYLTNLGEDQVASILLDMGIIQEAPDPQRPTMLCVMIKLNETNEHGLTTNEEYEAIQPIEDALGTSVPASLDAVHVGCLTTNGVRRYYFYAASDDGLEQAAEQALKPIGTHQWKCESKPDPQWGHYLELLYPSPYELQMLGNRDVLRNLLEAGDSLEKPREVTHWAYFPTEAARSQFVMALSSQGFEIKEEKKSDEPENPTPYGVWFGKVDSVQPDDIDELTIRLFDLAADAEGEYDGWETIVIKD